MRIFHADFKIIRTPFCTKLVKLHPSSWTQSSPLFKKLGARTVTNGKLLGYLEVQWQSLRELLMFYFGRTKVQKEIRVLLTNIKKNKKDKKWSELNHSNSRAMRPHDWQQPSARCCKKNPTCRSQPYKKAARRKQFSDLTLHHQLTG